MHKILLGLTTTERSDWRGKVEEVIKYNIRELALFPTCLGIEERKELYHLLKKTPLRSIPHAHLRDDMENWEVDYLYNNYGTRLFNIHSNTKAISFLNKSKYKKNIFLENTYWIDEAYINNLSKCGGICIDISHWETLGKKRKYSEYKKFPGLLKKYKIGCCHISGAKPIWRKVRFKDWRLFYSSNHYFDSRSDLSYVKKYVKYLPMYVSIELGNSFAEQIEIKKYLEKIINKNGY